MKLFLTIVFSIALLSTAIYSQEMPKLEPGVSHKLAKWRAKNYSDVKYDLRLTVRKGAETMNGVVGISVNVAPNSNETETTPIILDWRKIKGHETASNIKKATINGIAAEFEEVSEHIVFKKGVKSGVNEIRIFFESPILTTGGAITRYLDKKDDSEYIYSLFVPSDASTAFPVFDQPDLKAKFKLSMQISGDWVAVSNTPILKLSMRISPSSVKSKQDADKLKKGSKNNQAKVVQFSETKPISPYVFAFAVGNFRTIEDKKSEIPSKVYVRKSEFGKFESHKEDVFKMQRDSIKYLEDYFDYKFPFRKYDLVLIPEFPFGGMEHAGATFLRESAIIFPTEPTANNYIARAQLMFHENAHQWFGDTVTMKWFDDLWLKEGFATFMAYKTMEELMPEYNAWKVFYERVKSGAYVTDVTKGTTPIYQEIPNLNSAKSAYGNIVYNKAPSFLKQAEYFLGESQFQKAVQEFLIKHEYGNAEWRELVSEFEVVSGSDLDQWGKQWVEKPGLPIIRQNGDEITQEDSTGQDSIWEERLFVRKFEESPDKTAKSIIHTAPLLFASKRQRMNDTANSSFIFPNYKDYGYGIFLLDDENKQYIIENIAAEDDDFLRSMMWGSLWDSVRFAELDPNIYINLAIENIGNEKDASTISAILSRVGTAFTYYLSSKQQAEVAPLLENLLLTKIKTANTLGEKITYYRAYLGIASTQESKEVLKSVLKNNGLFDSENGSDSITIPLKTKDKFEIISKLIILEDPEALDILSELEKPETDDAAKRYAYAARAGIRSAENKSKYWNDFIKNKQIPESWIEASLRNWNSPKHAELTLPYLEESIAVLPDLKLNRKIFFINNWLGAFLGGQKTEKALQIIRTNLDNQPELAPDLKRKVLERMDGLERAVKIRKKYGE